MSVTDAERYHLYEALKTHLGEAPAGTLMSLIPPSGWSDVATTADLQRLSAATTADIQRLSTRIDALDERLEGLAGVIRAEMNAGFAAVRADLMRTLGTWLFASQAAVITAMAVMFAVFR